MMHDTSSNSTYIFDPESPEEMSRLLTMDQLTTRGMGGPLADLPALPEQARVLDVACGPGGWVLDVAYARPESEAAGVDISRTMIDYANARARSQDLKNASFGVMDITKPLDFSDNTFDLVNGRFLTTVLYTDAWEPFLQECMRILKPGGTLRFTETEFMGYTNSAAHERFRNLASLAMKMAGHGFSPDGQNFGITPVLESLIKKAGYHDIQSKPHAINFSAGRDAWSDFFRNAEIAGTMGKHLFVKYGMVGQEEIDRLYEQMVIEMHSDTFCGIWTFLSVWGTKPADSNR